MAIKKQNWYALVWWGYEKGKKEELVVGFSDTTLYRKKDDAILAFKHYPKKQTNRGYLEGWKIKRVRI